MALKLHIIICSTRPGRVGPGVAHWFHDFAERHGKFDCELIDLAEFDLPVYDEPHHPKLQKYENEHALEHAMLECLGEALWTAQRNGLPPDEAAYLECLKRL